MLSNPISISMKKNKNDHNGDNGISVMALGYAMNANPGPENKYINR